MQPAPAQRRSRRISLVAVLATVACLALVGWAVRGLLADPVPVTPDFGPAAATVEVDTLATADDAGPSPAAERSTAATAPPPRSAPSAAAGSIPLPGRSAASPPGADAAAEPVRLRVPSLELTVDVLPVGVAPDGQMGIPEEPDRAGWYRFGPAPGSDAGSVVVAGHVDTTTGPGAFLELTRVEEGAEVIVELDDGTAATYRVVGGETVAKTDLAVDEIFRRDGDPVLRMVTCTGDWSPRTGHYTDNLVITAVPVG